MPTQRYNVQQPPINSILSWIEDGDIAVPEIQRPFVWNATKVRNFLDSLFQGFPVGFLIAWKNPDVKLKDGTTSSGKRILIDGQQRVTALMAALLGREVVSKNYRTQRIRIAFHPIEMRFEVANPAIRKDASWIADIAHVFSPSTSIYRLVNEYCEKNPDYSTDEVFSSIERLRGITSNVIGLIELDHNLDIDTVTEIFIRVNSAGVPLSQADFAMSKIAVNETYGGNTLRKAIDYFCHLAIEPSFFTILRNDSTFTGSPFFNQMQWLKNETDDLYDPSYTDMLRVAFTSEFHRGRLEDLVALLSGRNFETREFEDAIVEDSFTRLSRGISRFMNETNFKRFLMIIRSSGFIDPSMIGSMNALNFAYVLYLKLRDQNLPPAEVEHQVRRWFVMSILTGRYSGSPETTIDTDIRMIHEQGIQMYAEHEIRGRLSEAFWTSVLPGQLRTASARPYFRVFQAAQVKQGDRGFLSRDLTVRDLIEVHSDVHHIFPRDFLKRHDLQRGQYNQIANFVVTQSEINIAIGNKEPRIYFEELREQCQGGAQKYGNIIDLDELRANFRMNAIPEETATMGIDDYSMFLDIRRRWMSAKIRSYFENL